MMSLYRQSNGERGGRRKMAVATLVACALVLADLWSGGLVRAEAQATAAWVGGGALSVLEWVRMSGFVSSRRKLVEENAALRAAAEDLEERTALLAVLQEENAELRSLVSLAERERGITAPIVSTLRASPYGTFLIGAGEDSGITDGALLLSPGGFIVGVATDSGARRTLAAAIFAPGTEVRGLVAGTPVLLAGHGGGNARAEAPRDIRISIGDVVTAPEYGGWPVGIVGEIEAESGDAIQTVYVRSPVNLASMRFVYVIAP